VLQTAEEQIPTVREIMNRTDVLESEPVSSSKTCVTSTLDGNEVIGIEYERVSNMTEERFKSKRQFQ
jgi:hypothetical protein